jgi:hypothetical protein
MHTMSADQQNVERVVHVVMTDACLQRRQRMETAAVTPFRAINANLLYLDAVANRVSRRYSQTIYM